MIIRQYITITIVLVGLVSGVCTNTCADTVKLKDGQLVYGTISGETSTAVTIDAANGRFTFLREKIIAVTKESPLRNEARQMEKFLSQGNLDAAIAFYRGSTLAGQLSQAELNASLLNNLGPVAAGVIATSGTAAWLAESLDRPPTPPSELLLLAAAVCMDSNNAETAMTLLHRLETAIPAHLNWPAESVSLLLERIVNSALVSKNGAVLASATSLATRLPLPAASSSQGFLATYAQIEDKMRRKEYLAAAAQFKPDMFLHRADLFVPLAERMLASVLAAPPSGETMAALESAKVSIVPYIDKRVAEQCMKVLVNRLLLDSRQGHAQHLIDSYSDNDPDMAATLQHLLDFQVRKTTLKPDTPMETYKLAAWGRSMGLLDEAKALFVTLRSDPRFSETVNLQLALIDHAQAEAEVARLRRLFDTEDLNRLKLESKAFLETDPPENFAQQARDLVQLADFQTWSAQRSSNGKAEAEYQQAERLVNRREFDQALMHLNQVQLDREDSAAAAKAQALRDKIMLEKLKEGRSRPLETKP
jgi:hypothetical protein